MSLMDTMDKSFEKQVCQLSEGEQKFVRGIKDKTSNIYSFMKPFLTAIALFWIFDRIRNRVGHEMAVYVCLVVIIIMLRLVFSRLCKILDK